MASVTWRDRGWIISDRCDDMTGLPCAHYEEPGPEGRLWTLALDKDSDVGLRDSGSVLALFWMSAKDDYGSEHGAVRVLIDSWDFQTIDDIAEVLIRGRSINPCPHDGLRRLFEHMGWPLTRGGVR